MIKSSGFLPINHLDSNLEGFFYKDNHLNSFTDEL